MNVLVDTHVALWFASGDPRLTRKMIEAFEDETNLLHLSVASVWEMAIKVSIGRLTLPVPLPILVDRFRDAGFRRVEIRTAHALGVESLPFVHRDPFDRLLAATCLAEGWALCSADTVFDGYGVERIA